VLREAVKEQRLGALACAVRCRARLRLRRVRLPLSNSAGHRSEDRFPPTRSRFDEMREEAFAKTMRHPLESKFVHEGRQPILLLAVAGGVAAGIGVSVIAAWFFCPGSKVTKKRPL
jgi:hypothetical protein